MTKNILVGITSSIAAYKIYELIRLYKQAGFNVRTVLTPNALNFVSPLVLETLTNEKCYIEQYGERSEVEHIHLTDWADCFVVAPMSANTISKCAAGVCDNLLTSVFCAYMGTKKPILIAPAMNENMLNNPVIQMNLDILETYCEIADPENGFLACGTTGCGRLCEVDKILQKTLRQLYQDKENNKKKVLVTVGGTKEALDSVRYITNYSSGRMGIALADWAYYKGYDVEAVTTIKTDRAYKTTNVQTALEMLNALKNKDFDYLLMAAAVGDFRSEKISDKKIEKTEITDNVEFKMVNTPDIVAQIAKDKKENQVIIGFCLSDSERLLEKAKEKLHNKNLDFIVANDIETALDSENNKVTIIKKDDTMIDIGLDIKEKVARKILEACL
ncbi:bifunctional phosphopantothenoylcysteine decarboxylase/phosphopantothenate--cysteine ligase CoaBC [bacterium]|nr:bifunctional phosphopantothenoylcysteine decarboxylase/phosphopantothenate--cysteine ligase CoaBC [bacterium]